MKKKKRIKWGKVIDFVMLAIFSILAIYLLIAMPIRGLSLFEFAMMIIFAVLADRSLNDVIEE